LQVKGARDEMLPFQSRPRGPDSPSAAVVLWLRLCSAARACTSAARTGTRPGRCLFNDDDARRRLLALQVGADAGNGETDGLRGAPDRSSSSSSRILLLSSCLLVIACAQLWFGSGSARVWWVDQSINLTRQPSRRIMDASRSLSHDVVAHSPSILHRRDRWDSRPLDCPSLSST